MLNTRSCSSTVNRQQMNLNFLERTFSLERTLIHVEERFLSPITSSLTQNNGSNTHALNSAELLQENIRTCFNGIHYTLLKTRKA
jgi:hypothetical protein